jgi:hypothetical protein
LKGLLVNADKSNALLDKAKDSNTKNVGMISELQRDNGKFQLNLRAANEKYENINNKVQDYINKQNENIDTMTVQARHCRRV